MHKKNTLDLHTKISNNLMYYIYENLSTDINIDDFAFSININKFHLHKIFKEQMHINIYQCIKSIRLQKASSLLLSNKSQTISKIANLCGYSSQTSFIRAFKNRFEQTPNTWRKGGYKEYSKKILVDSKHSFLLKKDFKKIDPIIVKTKKKELYYLRVQGYSRQKIKKSWQNIQAWIYTNKIIDYKQIAIFHDNPTITPHEKCFYIASILVEDEINIENSKLSSCSMKENLCASFEIKGKQGDMLRLIQWVYQEWLPTSDFDTTTSPSFAILKKNHFLDNSNDFHATFFLPIEYR